MTDRRLRRDIAWNVVPVALLAIVGLGSQLAIGRWWGADVLGVFNLVTTAMFVLAVVGAAGIQFSVLRAVAAARDDDEVAAIAVGALVPVAVLGSLAAALAYALRGAIGDLLDSPRAAIGLAYAAPGIAVFALDKVLLGIVNGRRRMRAYASYTSLRYALIAVGVVGARALALDGAQLAGIWTFVEAIVFVALAIETVATLPLARARGWRAHARDHLRFGARGVIATVATEIYGKLDIWMVGVALPEREVGIYSLASAVYEGALQLGTVVQNAVNPVLAAAHAAGRPDDVAALARRTRRWFVPAMIGACAVGAAVYPIAIPILVRPEYRAGGVPFALLMAGVALASPMLPFAQLLMMAARPGLHAVVIVGALVVALVGDLIAIPLLGIAGAGLATAISLVASAVLLRVLARAVRAWD